MSSNTSSKKTWGVLKGGCLIILTAALIMGGFSILTELILASTSRHGESVPADTVAKGETNVLALQFYLTVGSDSDIGGTVPTAGTAITATEDSDWDGGAATTDFYFYDKTDTGAWDAGNDWIGFDLDSDGVYTSAADTTVRDGSDSPTAGDTLSSTWTNMYYADNGGDDVYDSGEAIISSADATLDSGDTVITEGTADITAFASTDYVYDDNTLGDNNDYDNGEVIIKDNDSDGYPSSGDSVITSGKAGVIAFDVSDNVCFDGDDTEYDGTEVIWWDADGGGCTVAAFASGADVILVGAAAPSGSAGTEFGTEKEVSYLDDDNDGAYDCSRGGSCEVLVYSGSNTDFADGDSLPTTAVFYDSSTEATAGLATVGNGWDEASGFHDWTQMSGITDIGYCDNSHTNAYVDGEAIIREAGVAAIDTILEATDTVLTSGNCDLRNSWAAENLVHTNGGGNYDNTADIIDENVDGELTYSAAIDTRIGGVGPAAGTAIVDTKDADWTTVKFYDKNDGGVWVSGDDWVGLDADSNNYYLDQLNAITAKVNVDSTATKDDIDRVKFWLDGGNGNFEAGGDDILIGTADTSDTTPPDGYDFGGAEWYINGKTQALTAGTNRIFVSVDIVANPTDGHTIKMEVPTAAGTAPFDINDGDKGIYLASRTLGGITNPNFITIDAVNPTITNITSDKANGSYKEGEVIDIDVTFSENVTAAGNVTVNLDTGQSCTFTVNNASTGTCDYTVQTGDNSSDLNVSSISGTIADQAGNPMTNFTPTTNLAANKDIAIDTEPPLAPTITSIAADYYINNAEKAAIHVIGTAEVDSLVSVTLTDGTNSKTEIQQLSGGATDFDITIDGTDANPNALIDATITPSATAQDAAGNVSSATVTPTATQDTAAPIVAITAPLSGVEVNGAAVITFTDNELTDAQCSIDDTNWVVCTSGITTLSALDGWDALGQGAFTLYLKDTDTAGNVGTDNEVGIIKDTIAPTVPTALTFTASGGTVIADYVNTTNSNFTGQATITAGQATGGSAEWLIDDVSFSTPIQDLSIGAGDTTVVFDAGLSNNAAVQNQIAEGARVLKVKLCDVAGNCTNSMETKSITADYTVPTISSVALGDDEYVNAAETALGVNIVVNTTGVEDGQTITCYIKDVGAVHTLGPVTGSISSNTATIASGALTTLDDGTITATCDVSDVAGNAASQGSDTSFKDAITPSGYTVSIDQAYVNAGNETAMSFTFAGAEAGAIYSYSIDDTNAGTSAVTDSGTITTPTDQITGINISTLDDDTLTLTVYLTDPAGNQGSDATDTVIKDTENPTVTITSTASPGPTKTSPIPMTVTFSESVTGFDINDIIVVNGTKGNFEGSGADYTFEITATGEVAITVDIAADVAQDAAGNGNTIASQFSINFDDVAPTVTIVASDLSIYDGDIGADTFTIAATFSETMDNSVIPTATFNPALATTLTNPSGAWSDSDTVYTWTYDIEDAGVEIDDVDVTVDDGKDLAGNDQVANTNTDYIDVDTENPTVGIVFTDTSLIVGEDSLVTFTFHEAVTGFDNTDLTIANGTLTDVSSADGGITWTATFTPTDDLEDAENVMTLDNTGVTDLAGNAGVDTTDSNNYAIDTKEPTVLTIVANKTVISDSDEGVDAFTLTTTFSEEMNPAVIPAVTFNPALATTLTNPSGAWSVGDTVYTWTYDIEDAGVKIDDVDVTVDGGDDLAGNDQVAKTNTDYIDVDTENPTATIGVGTATIYDGDLVQEVTITYNKVMAASPNPTIVFNTTTGIWSTNGNGAWDGTAKIWTESFTIIDANEEVVGVDVVISGAKDAEGNIQTQKTESAAFNVDTKNPTGTVSVGTSTISESDLVQEVTITYDEVMDLAFSPTISFSGNTGTITSQGNGAWSGNTIWTESFNVVDANEETAAVTVSSSGAKDTVGNSEDTSISTTFVIDTKTPVVAVTSPNGGEVWWGGTTQNITWTATDANFGNTPITIEYSDDSGSSWKPVVNNQANSGVYSWSVPQWQAATYKIRITVVDTAGNSSSDQSDGQFSVNRDESGPSIVVNSPNGGEVWQGGSSQSITWSASDCSTVDIKYSNNGGTSWTSVASGETNDGSYLWSVPSINSTQCLVKITGSDASGNESFDSSDNVFSIDSGKPTVTITASSNIGSEGDVIIITATFNEDVKDNPKPKLALSGGAALAATEMTKDTDNRYIYSYTIQSVDDGDVTATVSIAQDLVGNEMDSASQASLFNVPPKGGPVVQSTINLAAGWNLVSLPLIPTNDSIGTVLAGLSNVNIVKYYDIAGGWLSYVPNVGGTLTTMEDGKGYWIYMNDPETLTINGSEMPGPAETLPAYSVAAGWNLIGFKSIASMKSSEYLSGVSYTIVYGYNTDYSTVAHPASSKDDDMISGSGYWLYASAAGNIVPVLIN